MSANGLWGSITSIIPRSWFIFSRDARRTASWRIPSPSSGVIFAASARSANLPQSAPAEREEKYNQDEECSAEDPQCAVCLEPLKLFPQHVLPCQHDFHAGCISQWLRRNNLCPVCRFICDSSVASAALAAASTGPVPAIAAQAAAQPIRRVSRYRYDRLVALVFGMATGVSFALSLRVMPRSQSLFQRALSSVFLVLRLMCLLTVHPRWIVSGVEQPRMFVTGLVSSVAVMFMV